ncbi:MAG: hypothetical protein J6X18_04050 [Bacteroidales bacterium]|nr:hypothetical protein [Bacteroidales bacterium]
MGGGSYSYISAHDRSVSYKSQSREQIFTSRHLDSEMNINGKIREARDSEEHPDSFPVIISLDVTGSMGIVPEWLVKHGFPEIMKKIMDEGIAHPQVCFVGFGDDYCDDAPIQVGQFESSDELTEKWLKKIWLEGGGGGNGSESVNFTWYFAAHHTSIDSFDKRGKKGCLITISDDNFYNTVSHNTLKEYFGNAESDLRASEMVAEASQKWDIYHIDLNDYLGSTPSIQKKWKELLGEDKVVVTENGEGKDIPEIIAGIILRSYNESGTSDERLDSNVI